MRNYYRSLLKSLPYYSLYAIFLVFLTVPQLQAENGAYTKRQIVRDQSPLSLLRSLYSPTFAPVCTEQATQGSSNMFKPCSVTVLSAWSNTALKRDHYTLDAESFSSDVILSWSSDLGFPTELSLTAPTIVRGGGYLDNFIEGWHEFFSLPNGDRDALSSRDFVLSGERRSGERFELSSGTGVGNIRLGSLSTIARDLYLRVEASLPSLSSGFGHNSVDGLLGLEIEQSYGDFTLAAGAAISIFADREIHNIRYERVVPQLAADVNYGLLEDLHIFSSLLYINDLVADLEDYPSSILYLDLGMRVLLDEEDSFSVSIRENPVGTKGSSDVDFLFSVRISL